MGKQNEKLLKNIELYEQKEKIEQQESKVSGPRTKQRQNNKKKNINVYRP